MNLKVNLEPRSRQYSLAQLLKVKQQEAWKSKALTHFRVLACVGVYLLHWKTTPSIHFYRRQGCKHSLWRTKYTNDETSAVLSLASRGFYYQVITWIMIAWGAESLSVFPNQATEAFICLKTSWYRFSMSKLWSGPVPVDGKMMHAVDGQLLITLHMEVALPNSTMTCRLLRRLLVSTETNKIAFQLYIDHSLRAQTIPFSKYKVKQDDELLTPKWQCILSQGMSRKWSSKVLRVSRSRL